MKLSSGKVEILKGVGSPAFISVKSEVMITLSRVSKSLLENMASRLMIRRRETIPPKSDLY
jgi:hypothetical protein